MKPNGAKILPSTDWTLPMRGSCLNIRLSDNRFDYGEERWISIGMLKTTVIALLAFTERNPDIVRVISLRKAKKHEKEKYERTIRN